mgnify:FL=1
MRRAGLLALALLLAGLLLPITDALARCTSYRAPVSMSKESFLQSPFGTIGLRYGRHRLLVLEGEGCFDLTRYGIGTAVFDLNSTAEPQAAYFAAAVTRILSEPADPMAPHRLELRRNESERHRADSWLRVTDDEPYFVAGMALNGSEFGVLRAAFAPQAMDLASAPAAANWHAVLAWVEGPRSGQVNFPVIANSRVGINSLTSGLAARLGEQTGAVFTKIYLTKFLTSPSPSLTEPILKPGEAECLHITHGIGGLADVSLTDTLDSVVLKLGAADC